MPFTYLHIKIDRGAGIALSRQVYEKIRDDILLKKLLPGSCLPATRTLAKELDVSRNVILEAYDQLRAEGYIESRAGSYTSVCDNTHYARYQQPEQKRQPKKPADRTVDISFKTGLPDLSLFPRTQWSRCLKEAVRRAVPDELAYYRPQGHTGFRQVLAQYLYRARGIEVRPQQIVVTSGATQALFLAAQVLFSPGCCAVLEDPCGYGVARILKTAGYGLKAVKYQEKGYGITRQDIVDTARLVYVTPSHQFPMGRIMPAQHRISLLNAVDGKETFIVEDDYDSEFRYEGAPIHPLKALNPEKVIYLGSFSKVLSPGLRIGYAVVPPILVDKMKQLKRFSDAQSPVIDQIALQWMIQKGEFERHIFKMKKVYHRKRNTLVSELSRLFGRQVTVFGENAGLHLVAQFNNSVLHTDERYNVICNRVQVGCVEKHAVIKGDHRDKLVFGYGNLGLDEIRLGVQRLKQGL
jgi:GntR family transcriptional regulator/MocR family aminotransferase